MKLIRNKQFPNISKLEKGTCVLSSSLLSSSVMTMLCGDGSCRAGAGSFVPAVKTITSSLACVRFGVLTMSTHLRTQNIQFEHHTITVEYRLLICLFRKGAITGHCLAAHFTAEVQPCKWPAQIPWVSTNLQLGSTWFVVPHVCLWIGQSFLAYTDTYILYSCLFMHCISIFDVDAAPIVVMAIREMMVPPTMQYSAQGSFGSHTGYLDGTPPVHKAFLLT